MIFQTTTSPHTHQPLSTAQVMQNVILATLPGLLLLTYFFGWGYFINVALACLVAIGCESLMLRLRKRPISFYLKDYSAVLTAVLIALALPPFSPWWVTTVATAFAIIVAKHLYGGLGNNPFNPAMTAYALVLVSFPVEMTTRWGVPFDAIAPNVAAPGLWETLTIIFGGYQLPDGFTMATPLDTYKNLIAVQTSEEITQGAVFQGFIANGWEWVSLAYLAGGLYLIARKIIQWYIPVAMLSSLSVMSLIFGFDADQHVPLHLHLLGGATMLGAFFIATDPVSAATSIKGKLFYGAGIGILVFIIRTWGSYPDGVAFAVLLMNFAAPLLDHYTQPVAYGHSTSRSNSES